MDCEILRDNKYHKKINIFKIINKIINRISLSHLN